MSVKDTDLGWREIVKELTLFSELEVLIGFQGGNIGEVALIASYHEFGTTDGAGNLWIPARPFLSSAMDVGKEQIGKALDAALNAMVNRTQTAIQAASRLGLLGVSLVKKRILSSKEWAKSLELETVARKGSSKPLIDTAQMINSVTYAVKRGETVVAQG